MSEALVKVNPNLPIVADMKGFASYLKQHEGMLAKVAASHMQPERVLRILMGSVQRTPKLAECTMLSVFRAAMIASELGLEPGGALGHAYLVPFMNNKTKPPRLECQFMPGYKGLVDLVRRSGDLKDVYAYPVFAGDEFHVQLGLHRDLVHVPCGEDDPAKLTHAYCVFEFTNGGQVWNYLNRKQIESRRQRSRAANAGPWVSDYVAMALKTVVRFTANLCPMSIEVTKAMAVDRAVEVGESVEEGILASDEILEAEFGDDARDEPPQVQSSGVDATRARVTRPAAAKSAAPAPAPEPPAPVADPGDDTQDQPEEAAEPAPVVTAAPVTAPEPTPAPEPVEDVAALRAVQELTLRALVDAGVPSGDKASMRRAIEDVTGVVSPISKMKIVDHGDFLEKWNALSEDEQRKRAADAVLGGM